MTTEEICELYDIRNYTINKDGSVDVDNQVYLFDRDLTKLPLKFGVVSGSFNCSENGLTTLEGSPKKVGGYFKCSNNKLTSLEGGPDSVDSYFDCNDNQLTTLEGSPENISGFFYCDNNNLTDLKGSPENIAGDFYCDNNKLTTLEGCPNHIGGGFYCLYNPIGSISKQMEIDFIKAFNTFKVIKGNEINLKRLRYVMEMFDKPINIDNIQKHYKIV